MHRLLSVASVVALSASAVFAQPQPAKTDLVEFEMMTWPEVKAAMAAGKTTALVYTGGTEQRGPQNVNGGHTLMGREIVKAIALRLGNAIAMPVLPYTPNNASADLPGTIGLTPEILAVVLERIVEQSMTTGFKNVVIMGDHGGGQPTTYADVAKKMDAKYASAAGQSRPWPASGAGALMRAPRCGQLKRMAAEFIGRSPFPPLVVAAASDHVVDFLARLIHVRTSELAHERNVAVALAPPALLLFSARPQASARNTNNVTEDVVAPAPAELRYPQGTPPADHGDHGPRLHRMERRRNRPRSGREGNHKPAFRAARRAAFSARISWARIRQPSR